jgi:hypothetical protein
MASGSAAARRDLTILWDTPAHATSLIRFDLKKYGLKWITCQGRGAARVSGDLTLFRKFRCDFVYKRQRRGHTCTFQVVTFDGDRVTFRMFPDTCVRWRAN